MSKIKVNSIEAATGSTITIPSGQTLDISSTTLTLPSTVVTTTGTQTLTNKTIGVSQLSGTLPVANGGTGLTALGTAAQVLRVNSGATALEFATPAVASSDFVKLATQDISASTASVSFDGYFTSDYDIYLITINDVILTTNDVYLRMRFRRSNADVSTGDYKAIHQVYVSNATRDDSVRTGQTGFHIGESRSHGTSSGSTAYQMWIYYPLKTNQRKRMIIQGGHFLTYFITVQGSGYLDDNNNALSGFSFFADSGNIASGNFKLYGLK